MVVRGWSFAMTDPVDLTVKVLNSEIVISRPETGDQVTFRKDGPVLTSLDSMRIDPDRARLQEIDEGRPVVGRVRRNSVRLHRQITILRSLVQRFEPTSAGSSGRSPSSPERRVSC